ncbi:MAG: lipopolysaccharide transport system permease protein [Crocinitomicaceae bacterium]
MFICHTSNLNPCISYLYRRMSEPSNTIIDSQPIGLKDYIQRIIRYRSLIFALAKRDVKAKYTQTTLGVLWAIIQPIIALLIFSVFFQGLIKLETGDVPYPVFAFSGMILWYYFSNIIHQSGSALVAEQDLIKKIYFPRLILPLYKAFIGLFELGIAFLLLIIILLIWKVDISYKICFAPLIILLVTFIGLTVSIWLNALTVRKRDLLHLVPYLINYGIWLTPVFYPSTIIPEPYQDWLYYLNPIAVTIELFRAALLDLPFEWMHCISFIPVLLMFVVGVYVFKKTEKNIADYV